MPCISKIDSHNNNNNNKDYIYTNRISEINNNINHYDLYKHYLIN